MRLPTANEISGYDVDRARGELAAFAHLVPELIEQNHRQSKLIGKLMEQVAELSQGKYPVGELSRSLYLERLQKIVFGDKSERRIGLPAAVVPSAGSGHPTEEKKKAKRGRTAQPDLPIVEIRHELPENERICTACGEFLKEWAGQFEESMMVQVVPARFVMEKHLRKKYRCACGGCIKTAAGPLKLKEGGRYAPEVHVEIAVNKYGLHLPLDRQVGMMKSSGLKIESQTLFSLIDDLAFYLRPLVDLVRAHIADGGVFGGDETHWKNLQKKKGGKANKRYQLWSLSGADAVYFEILDSRGTDSAKKIMAGLKGVLICDACPSYDSLESEELLLAACWAHVRRRFTDAEKDFPREAKRFLSLIRKLYRIEERLKGKPPDQILRFRRLKSTKIVNQIRRRLEEHRNSMRTLALGSAVQYALEQWRWLKRFLDHPGVPLDNNQTERSLRGPVVGRKNHYGSRSKQGADVAQILYTLIETCKLNGVDARSWMNEAIRALLTKQKITMPWEIAVGKTG